MSFILPLHCNSREGFIRGIAAGRGGDTAIDRGTVELRGRKHWECVSRARQLFIGITAIYINRISLPVTTAIRPNNGFLPMIYFSEPSLRKLLLLLEVVQSKNKYRSSNFFSFKENASPDKQNLYRTYTHICIHITV